MFLSVVPFEMDCGGQGMCAQFVQLELGSVKCAVVKHKMYVSVRC